MNYYGLGDETAESLWSGSWVPMHFVQSEKAPEKLFLFVFLHILYFTLYFIFHFGA